MVRRAMLLAAIPLSFGCTHVGSVKPADPADPGLGALRGAVAARRPVTVTLTDGRVFGPHRMALEGDSAIVGDPGLAPAVRLSMRDVAEVSFTKSSRGALDGLWIGPLVGVGLGLLTGAVLSATSRPPVVPGTDVYADPRWEAVWFFSIYGAATGVVVGPVFGGLHGSRVVFRFER